MPLNRRNFLRKAGAGVVLASLPPLWPHTARGVLLHGPEGAGGGGGGSAGSAGGAGGGAAGGHTTYFDAFGVDTGLISRILAKGLSRGGEFSEVYLQHRISHWVGLEDGKVNRAYTTVDLGAGIRVLKGDATGYAFSEDLSEAALLATAATAAAVADGTPAAEVRPLAAVAVPNRYPVAVPWSDVGMEAKLPILERADKKARGADPHISQVVVYLSDETTRILVANSEGRLVQDDQPMALLSVNCVAEKKGQRESSWQSGSARDGLAFFGPEKVDEVAGEAAAFTMLLFDAAQPPAGEYPVVLAPGLSGILLHEAIGHGMEADFNRKGISVYAGRIGQRIAPAAVSIIDDGTNERLRGSVNIDDEGTEAQRTVLVENGILRSYLHDRISAAHYKVPSTGSGRRESFRFPPVPRMRNTYMLGGSVKPEEVIASVKRGLYAEMFANGQVMIGAGDFTFYLKHGRMIEDGKLTHVVKDANLIGNGPQVLEHVDLVADDPKLYSGGGYCGKDGQRIPVGFGLPTVRAGAISIGGRQS